MHAYSFIYIIFPATYSPSSFIADTIRMRLYIISLHALLLHKQKNYRVNAAALFP